MAKIKPRFMYNDKGEKIGVVLKVEEFEQLIDELEDIDDYEYIKKVEGKKSKGVPLEDVMALIEERK